MIKLITTVILYWHDLRRGQPRGRLIMFGALRQINLVQADTFRADLDLRLLSNSNGIHEIG